MMFGRFELLDRIGLGGMAEVWRARVTGVGGFEKMLVIKKILPSFASNKTFIDMLLAEARLCAMLQHANIVQTYENGEIDGAYYIAMEYVQGFDLFKILSKSTQIGLRIPPELCLYMSAEAAKGLHYAHTAKDHYGRPLNIIHRDVSPSNVIISNQGEVKVMDFGVARATPGGQPSDQMTRSGVLKGKLGYMSPEQVTGKPFDHRSDVFSLGIILYESLTLKRLFLAKTDLETLVNIRDAKIEHKFQKHSYIEEDVRIVLRKALAKEPDERYPTAMAMHDDIIRLLFERKVHVTSSMLMQFLADLFAHEAVLPPPPPVQLVGPGRSNAGVPDPASQPAGPIALPSSPGTGAPQLLQPTLPVSPQARAEAHAAAQSAQSTQAAQAARVSAPQADPRAQQVAAASTPAQGGRSQSTGSAGQAVPQSMISTQQMAQTPGRPMPAVEAQPAAAVDFSQTQGFAPPQAVDLAAGGGRDTAPQQSWDAQQATAQKPGGNASLSFSQEDMRRIHDRINQQRAQQGVAPLPVTPPQTPPPVAHAELRDTREMPRVEIHDLALAGDKQQPPAGQVWSQNQQPTRPQQVPYFSGNPSSPGIPAVHNGSAVAGSSVSGQYQAASASPAASASTARQEMPAMSWPGSSPNQRTLGANGAVLPSWPSSSPSQRTLERSSTPQPSWPSSSPSQRGLDRQDQAQPSWPGSTPSQRSLERADGGQGGWGSGGGRDTQPMRKPTPGAMPGAFSPPMSRPSERMRTEPTYPDVEVSVPQGGLDRSQPSFDQRAEPGSYTVAVPGKGTPPPVFRLRTADGQEFGPLSQSNIESMLRARTASPDDMVSFGGMPFQPIRTVPALQSAIQIASPVAHQPPTMQGNLNQWVFVRLVYRLFADRSSGCLELRRGDAVKSLFFRRGRIQYIASNQQGELLGPFMVANGFISQSDIDMAIARSKSTGGRLGDLLIGMNLIKPHQLVQVLEKQLRAKLVDAFGWDQGTYAFYDGVEAPADIVTLDVDPIELLVEGVRERVPLAAIEPMIQDKLDRPLYPMKAPLISIAALKLGARETKALTMLQNARTPRDAYQECFNNRPQRLALLQVIMLLLQTDLVTFDSERAA